MIRESTCLILGAGASMPYGLPSGLQLRAKVIELLSERADSRQFFLEADPKWSAFAIDSFRKALRRSGSLSIDSFLEHRPQYSKIGKRAIAYALLPEERTDCLYSPAPAGGSEPKLDWYNYLFHAMWDRKGWDGFGVNLSIVTLNYDRSFEHYMYTALQYSSDREPREVAAKMETIPIVHVYGSLGVLPWQGSEGVEFGATLSQETVRAAADGIRILPEAEKTSQAFRQARELIQTSQRTHILGFGFHDLNIVRLGLHEPDHSTTCGLATTKGLERAEAFHAHRYFGKRWGLAPADEDSLTMLRRRLGPELRLDSNSLVGCRCVASDTAWELKQ